MSSWVVFLLSSSKSSLPIPSSCGLFTLSFVCLNKPLNMPCRLPTVPSKVINIRQENDIYGVREGFATTTNVNMKLGSRLLDYAHESVIVRLIPNRKHAVLTSKFFLLLNTTGECVSQRFLRNQYYYLRFRTLVRNFWRTQKL